MACGIHSPLAMWAASQYSPVSVKAVGATLSALQPSHSFGMMDASTVSKEVTTSPTTLVRVRFVRPFSVPLVTSDAVQVPLVPAAVSAASSSPATSPARLPATPYCLSFR